MTINGYLLNLEIDLVLEMFANRSQEVIECVVELAWVFFLGAQWADVEEDFSPSCCSTSPIQAKSFDVNINVAICLEQGVADCQMLFRSGSGQQ